MDLKFQSWPKIPRLRRDMTITEKIDGTNAAVGILTASDEAFGDYAQPGDVFLEGQLYRVYAQSRKRLITPEDDNYGFAKWAFQNREHLVSVLGPGLHFGEWWGQGVQRSYGLDHKRFSLFNTSRWGWLNIPEAREAKGVHDQLWSVPVLSQHTFDTFDINDALDELKIHGSQAAPGFMNPEGIIVYHHAANAMFKVTIDGDEKGKGE